MASENHTPLGPEFLPMHAPIAYMWQWLSDGTRTLSWSPACNPAIFDLPLFANANATPIKSMLPRTPLTTAQIRALMRDKSDWLEFARAIERAHGVFDECA